MNLHPGAHNTESNVKFYKRSEYYNTESNVKKRVFLEQNQM